MMRIAFVSNFMNHHQLPLCRAFLDILGDDRFRFIATTPFDEARLAAGYADMNRSYPWIMRPYDSEAEHERALDFADSCDALVSMPERLEYVNRRISGGKLIYLYSERIFKHGLFWRLLPPKIARTRRRYVEPLAHENAYLLCSGSYVSYDLGLFGIPESKCLKWGYYPAVDGIGDVKFADRNDEMLWVGRMLSWKRPLYALEGMLPILLGGGMHATFIGDGPFREKLEATIQRAGLEDAVSVIGSLPNREVIEKMLHSKYFVTTSNYREGWGAVVNEAMACGLVVCASEAMGSVPYLVQDGINGFSFPYNKIDVLQTKLIKATADPELAASVGGNARATMNGLWSAKCAAERLVEVSKRHLSGELGTPFEEGPCSYAERINPRNYF